MMVAVHRGLTNGHQRNKFLYATHNMAFAPTEASQSPHENINYEEINT